jgi:putative spermidine/putrescine transport system permease protein
MRRSLGKIGLNSFILLVAIFLIVPTLVVIPLSFTTSPILTWPPHGFTWEWYEVLFTDPEWSEAFLTSLKVAGLTVVFATALGTVTALGMARGRFRGKALTNLFFLSPMIVPVVVLALGVFVVFIKLRLVGTVLGLAVADTVLALPLVLISVSNSLRSVDRNLELAAQNLGAGPVRTFTKVTLPLILPGVIAGALFAFVTSWDEIVCAIFLTTPFVRTLPVVIFNSVRQDIEPTIAAAATLLLAVTTLALFVSLAVSLIPRRRGTETI